MNIFVAWVPAVSPGVLNAVTSLARESSLLAEGVQDIYANANLRDRPDLLQARWLRGNVSLFSHPERRPHFSGVVPWTIPAALSARIYAGGGSDFSVPLRRTGSISRSFRLESTTGSAAAFHRAPPVSQPEGDAYEAAFDRITGDDKLNPVRSEALRVYHLPVAREDILRDAREKVRLFAEMGQKLSPEEAVRKVLEFWSKRIVVDKVYEQYEELMREQGFKELRPLDRRKFALKPATGAGPLNNFMEILRLGLRPGVIVRGQIKTGEWAIRRIRWIHTDGRIKVGGERLLHNPFAIFHPAWTRTHLPQHLDLPEEWQEALFVRKLHELLGQRERRLSEAKQNDVIDAAMCLAAAVHHNHRLYSGERTVEAFLRAVLPEK